MVFLLVRNAAVYGSRQYDQINSDRLPIVIVVLLASRIVPVKYVSTVLGVHKSVGGSKLVRIVHDIYIPHVAA